MKTKALLVAAAVLLGTAGAANAEIVGVTGTTVDGNVAAQADVTFGNGFLNISLSNLITGQRSSGQSLSSFEFNISGVTAISLISQNGQLVNVSGSTVTPISGTPDHWVAGTFSGGGFTLNTVPGAGGQPDDMILGLNPAGNNGISVFDPYIYGTGTFELACTGCTTSSTLSAYSFNFGTEPITVAGSVPEPGTWIMMILGFLGLGFVGYRKQQSSFRFA